MTKEAVFTMKLEMELRDSFMAEAEASHRPASQILRDLMREFIERQREARQFEEFLREKITNSRNQINNGNFASDEEGEARFVVRRAELQRRADSKDE